MSDAKLQHTFRVTLCAILACLLSSPQAHAIRFDWTPTEIACAASKGITLNSETDPSGRSFVDYLSWLADHVVLGTVGETRHDILGPYPTLVDVTIASSLKGGLPVGSTITLALNSGPAFGAVYGLVGQIYAGRQATYLPGQNVLLFLSAGYDIMPERPTYYVLPPGHYRPIDGYKFTLLNGSFALDDPGIVSFPAAYMFARIAAIVAAQRSQCAAGNSRLTGGGSGSGDPAEGEIEGAGDASISAPISAELKLCPDRVGQAKAWNASSVDPEDLEYRPTCAGCGDGLGLALRRYLRSVMRLTANGSHYLDLWKKHRVEVVAIFNKHPEVGELVGARINDFMPGLRSYLFNDINGVNFTIDATRIAQIEEVVSAVRQYGTAALQADLDAFVIAVQAEYGKSMKAGLAHFIGIAP